MVRSLFILVLLSVCGPLWAAPPDNFRQAKVLAKKHVYHDQSSSEFGDLYCGCSWTWTGESGGRMDHGKCGYTPRSRSGRADRLEWEHIMPASWFGQQRLCWQNGGRDNCQSSDPVFSAMEADLHNLYPAVGEVNADRSNYSLSILPASMPATYGQCPTKVDFKERVTDPRPQARGMIARVHFYMADRYNLRLSPQHQRVLMAWDKYYPVSAWEIERDRRIAKIMGVSNPFVSGARKWTEAGVVQVRPNAYPDGPVPAPVVKAKPIQEASSEKTLPVLVAKPVIPGVSTPPPSEPIAKPKAPPTSTPKPKPSAPVLGNRASGIYHVSGVCPGYDKISERNRVPFSSEKQAQDAGFRRAGNCQ